MEDMERVELLLRLERTRREFFGMDEYRVQLHGLAVLLGIPAQDISELCADLESGKPVTLLEISRPVGQVALLEGDDVRPLEEIKAEVIRFALKHYGRRMSEVARRLKIGRSTLYRKLESLGIPP